MKALWQVKTHNSIRTKFLVAFSALFTFVFVVTGLVSMRGLPFSTFDGWAGSARRTAERELSLLADLQKQALLQWFLERRGDIKILTDSTHIKEHFSSLNSFTAELVAKGGEESTFSSKYQNREDFNHLRTFLLSVQAAYRQNQGAIYNTIRIVDFESQRVLVSTENTEIGFGLDRTGASNLDGSQASTTNFRIEYPKSAASPEHINIVRPLLNQRDMVIGIVIMEVKTVDVFAEILDIRASLGETGEALLVDENVRILTPLRHHLSDGRPAAVGQYKIAAQPAVLAASGDEGMIESTDYRGHEVIAAYRYLDISPDLGIGMVIKIDRSELYAEMNQSLRFSLWIAGAGLILIVFLTLLLTRQLTGPLRRMAKTASRLAAGDRSARTELDTEDEIGLLSTTFDLMAERIEVTWRDLEQRSVELDAVNAELESFAYSIAHDLRAPLRAIDGFSLALLEDHSPNMDEEAKQYLQYVREGSQEMAGLIDDLLQLSRVTRGEMSFETADLSAYATEIMDALKKTDTQRDVMLEITPGIVVNGDPRLLRVMMENLLGNAWKFSAGAPQAHIGFTAERLKSKFRCTVKDNGAGFDMTYQNKLFEPFHRLHTQDEFEGTGIGLATVQRIINRHHGIIWAKAKVGEGASFIFELDSGVTGDE